MNPFDAMLAQAGTQFMSAFMNNPQGVINALDQLEEAIHPHHTGYDACQDILDAVEAGHLSHSAALQAIAVLMADMERRGQKSAAPPRRAPAPPQNLTAWEGGTPLDQVAEFFRALS